MNTQPEALTLEARCTLSEQCLPDAPYRVMLTKLHSEMLAELRRQHEANQELLEALKGMVQLDEEEHQRGQGDIDICKEVQDAYAAIAKHGGAA